MALKQKTITDIAIKEGYDRMNTFELLDTYLDRHLDYQMLGKEHEENGYNKENAMVTMENELATIEEYEGFGEEKKNGNVALNKDSITYTVYQSPGSLEVQNDEEIPDRYLKLSTKLDRARLRKDIIKDGDTDYASVPKVKRLRIK